MSNELFGRKSSRVRAARLRQREHIDNQLVAEPLESRVLLSVGATVPYTTYEAESGAYSATLLGGSYVQNTVQAESSGRSAVRLSNSGNYVQFTAAADANSVVVRYSIPDAAGGGG